MTITLIVLGIIVVLLVVFFLGMYNGLIKLRNLVQEAWAQIDVELKRRHDLIGNLVETVKGYAAHEKGTLEEVTRARAGAVAATQGNASPADVAKSEAALTQALVRLNAVAEAYPDLKANTNFQQLQTELANIENKLSAARRFFNNAVSEYNASIQAFPAALFSASLGFREREFFDVGEDSRKQLEVAPQVKF